MLHLSTGLGKSEEHNTSSKLIFSVYSTTVSWLRQLYVSGRENKIITEFQCLEDDEEIVLTPLS